MKIDKIFLTNPISRPHLRNNDAKYLMQPLGISWHWTANPHKGADARANRNYFNNLSNARYPKGAQFIVDSKGVIQCMPDNEVTFHSSTKDGNYNYIGIELCVNDDWVSVYKNAIELGRHLSKKFNFKISQHKRHFDFNGKDCPKMFVPIDYKVNNKKYKGEWNWELFLHNLEHGMKEIVEKMVTVEKEIIVEKEVVKEIESTKNKDLTSYHYGDLIAAIVKKLRQ